MKRLSGVEETRLAARGIYRDPVRSSKKVVVKTSGLRWISLMLLTPVPWAKRVWALPFLTVLAPSERYHEERKKKHKTITDWERSDDLPTSSLAAQSSASSGW
jgi:hypothetical protein